MFDQLIGGLYFVNCVQANINVNMNVECTNLVSVIMCYLYDDDFLLWYSMTHTVWYYNCLLQLSTVFVHNVYLQCLHLRLR